MDRSYPRWLRLLQGSLLSLCLGGISAGVSDWVGAAVFLSFYQWTLMETVE